MSKSGAIVYTCAGCKAVLPVLNGQPVRKCSCDTPILASMSAVARGAGGVK